MVFDIGSYLNKFKHRKEASDVAILYFLAAIDIIVWVVVYFELEPPQTGQILHLICGGVLAICIFGIIMSNISNNKSLKLYQRVLSDYEKAFKGIRPSGSQHYVLPNYQTFGQIQFTNREYRMWVDQGRMVFLPSPPANLKDDILLSTIELETSKIISYYQTGQKFLETKISGGGSTGANVPGAILGGAVGGMVGALIGGQSKTDPITSETIVHDERVTYVIYNNNGESIALRFDYDFYNILVALLPEKDRVAFSGMPVNRPQQSVGQSNNEIPIADKIKQLDNLLAQGIITESEYRDARAELIKNYIAH